MNATPHDPIQRCRARRRRERPPGATAPSASASHCPEIAAAIRPGQFVMLRLPGTDRPAARPAVRAVRHGPRRGRRPIGIDVVYLVVGKMTGLLADVAGRRHGSTSGARSATASRTSTGPSTSACVAGGIGQTPFLAYVRELLGTRGYGGRPARQTRRPRARSTTACGRRTWPRASRTSAPPAARCIWPATTARSAIRGFVTQLLARTTGRPARSSAAARSRCCTPWRS